MDVDVRMDVAAAVAKDASVVPSAALLLAYAVIRLVTSAAGRERHVVVDE